MIKAEKSVVTQIEATYRMLECAPSENLAPYLVYEVSVQGRRVWVEIFEEFGSLEGVTIKQHG